MMNKLDAKITWDEVISADVFLKMPRRSVGKKPGVYGIKRAGQWQYVGRSINNVYERLSTHIFNKEIFQNAPLEEFELYVKVCKYPILEELKYIYFLRPILNAEVRESYGLQDKTNFIDKKEGLWTTSNEAKERLVKML